METNGAVTTQAEGTSTPAKAARAIVHRTPQERQALGKAARTAIPRASQATYEPPANRLDPVALLEQQAVSRVPELVPIRYGRMLQSPFSFYRGAALIMASDLAGTPRSDLTVQACGDAHMSNFGVFGSPERNLIFDLNDFDESLPGPWEWDVKRLTASLAVAGRYREFSDAECNDMTVRAARSYRTAMLQFATMSNLDVWYAHSNIDSVMADFGSQLTPQGRKRTAKTLAKARTRDSLQAFEKLTHLVDGQRRIISDPPLIVPIEELLSEAALASFSEKAVEMMARYRKTLLPDRRHLLEQFRLVQMARKVVGVGSVGTRAWILLMMGRDDNDPLFLQVKEAEASVLERFLKKSIYVNHGQRVVSGQRLMQSSSDILLGWERTEGIDGKQRDFYFRQLRDWKGSAEIDQMLPVGMAVYGELCGWTLARAHARSGDRIAIASYLGKGDAFDRAIATFSTLYADQNERDFGVFKKAVESGRIVAETGI